MPGMDGTGPMGFGAQTGRGTGLCRNTYPNGACGFGRGFRRNCANFSSGNAQTLTEYADSLEKRLNEVKARINDIK